MKYASSNRKNPYKNLSRDQKKLLTEYYRDHPDHKWYDREEFKKAIKGRHFAICMGWSKVPLKIYKKILIDNCHKRAIFENILYDDKHKTLGGGYSCSAKQISITY